MSSECSRNLLVPNGLREFMKELAKEILHQKPSNIYEFAEKYCRIRLSEEERKVRGVETTAHKYSLKNKKKSWISLMEGNDQTGSQVPPISLVYSIVPQDLTELIKLFIKAVLKEQPADFRAFGVDFFNKMNQEFKSSNKSVNYSSFESYFQNRRNLSLMSKDSNGVSFIRCQCGRILNSSDIHRLQMQMKSIQEGSRMNYMRAVVIIQRYFRNYLKRKQLLKREIRMEMAVLLIQRHLRRFIEKRKLKSVEKTTAKVVEEENFENLQENNEKCFKDREKLENERHLVDDFKILRKLENIPENKMAETEEDTDKKSIKKSVENNVKIHLNNEELISDNKEETETEEMKGSQEELEDLGFGQNEMFLKVPKEVFDIEINTGNQEDVEIDAGREDAKDAEKDAAENIHNLETSRISGRNDNEKNLNISEIIDDKLEENKEILNETEIIEKGEERGVDESLQNGSEEVLDKTFVKSEIVENSAAEILKMDAKTLEAGRDSSGEKTNLESVTCSEKEVDENNIKEKDKMFETNGKIEEFENKTEANYSEDQNEREKEVNDECSLQSKKVQSPVKEAVVENQNGNLEINGDMQNGDNVEIKNRADEYQLKEKLEKEKVLQESQENSCKMEENLKNLQNGVKISENVKESEINQLKEVQLPQKVSDDDNQKLINTEENNDSREFNGKDKNESEENKIDDIQQEENVELQAKKQIKVTLKKFKQNRIEEEEMETSRGETEKDSKESLEENAGDLMENEVKEGITDKEEEEVESLKTVEDLQNAEKLMARKSLTESELKTDLEAENVKNLATALSDKKGEEGDETLSKSKEMKLKSVVNSINACKKLVNLKEAQQSTIKSDDEEKGAIEERPTIKSSNEHGDLIHLAKSKELQEAIENKEEVINGGGEVDQNRDKPKDDNFKIDSKEEKCFKDEIKEKSSKEFQESNIESIKEFLQSEGEYCSSVKKAIPNQAEDEFHSLEAVEEPCVRRKISLIYIDGDDDDDVKISVLLKENGMSENQQREGQEKVGEEDEEEDEEEDSLGRKTLKIFEAEQTIEKMKQRRDSIPKITAINNEKLEMIQDSKELEDCKSSSALGKSVTIDETVRYINRSTFSNDSSSQTEGADLSTFTKHRLMAPNYSEADSDYMQKSFNEGGDGGLDSDNISTALIEAGNETSTDSDSLVTAVKRTPKNGGQVSFGNAAITESLEQLAEGKKTASQRDQIGPAPMTTAKSGVNSQTLLALKRSTFQRSIALQNDSSNEESSTAKIESKEESSKISSSFVTGTSFTQSGSKNKSELSQKLRWLALRQNSMPVQIDSEVFRMMPKHLPKRVSSAEEERKTKRRLLSLKVERQERPASSSEKNNLAH